MYQEPVAVGPNAPEHLYDIPVRDNRISIVINMNSLTVKVNLNGFQDSNFDMNSRGLKKIHELNRTYL